MHEGFRVKLKFDVYCHPHLNETTSLGIDLRSINLTVRKEPPERLP